eukprot:366426-Chlamydomonas_euryale.AAC.23
MLFVSSLSSRQLVFESTAIMRSLRSPSAGLPVQSVPAGSSFARRISRRHATVMVSRVTSDTVMRASAGCEPSTPSNAMSPTAKALDSKPDLCSETEAAFESSSGMPCALPAAASLLMAARLAGSASAPCRSVPRQSRLNL